MSYASHDRLSQIPPRLQGFLTSTGSLTALLEAQADKPLRVEIISEGYEPLGRHDKQLLGLLPNKPQLAWVRTVKLYGSDAQAWVLARSIFPLLTLTGSLKRLRHLGRTPIGYVLFKRKRRLPHQRHYYQTHQGCHGRSTVYDYQGYKLLIDECFLQDFVHHLSKTPQKSPNNQSS